MLVFSSWVLRDAVNDRHSSYAALDNDSGLHFSSSSSICSATFMEEQGHRIPSPTSTQGRLGRCLKWNFVLHCSLSSLLYSLLNCSRSRLSIPGYSGSASRSAKSPSLSLSSSVSSSLSTISLQGRFSLITE